MTGPEPDIERAYDALEEYGCPICGEPASHLTVQFIDAIRITPCHHIATIEDAIHMEQFYETLRRTEIRRDL